LPFSSTERVEARQKLIAPASCTHLRILDISTAKLTTRWNSLRLLRSMDRPERNAGHDTYPNTLQGVEWNQHNIAAFHRSRRSHFIKSALAADVPRAFHARLIRERGTGSFMNPLPYHRSFHRPPAKAAEGVTATALPSYPTRAVVSKRHCAEYQNWQCSGFPHFAFHTSVRSGEDV
jgi:hypothetical protein